MPPDSLSRKLLNTALRLFRDEGYSHIEPGRIAGEAGCSLDELYARFPRKEAFVMALYERITQQLQSHVAEAPRGTVSARFQFMFRRLLVSLQPHRPLLRHLLPASLDPDDRLGVLGQSTDYIRAEVQAIFTMLVLGAANAPPADEADSLVQFLYFAHLGLIFLFIQEQHEDSDFMENNLQLAGDLITIGQKTLLGRHGWLSGQLARLAGLPRPDQVRQRVERLMGDYLHPPHDSVHFSQAENILRDLFRFRRLQPPAGSCQSDPCLQCLALHLPKVQRAISSGEPVRLVLPAFPAKSANLEKVLGPLPDLGEELALRFLGQRCGEMERIYPPGGQVTICSDGRVFSDLVGVADEDVTAYRHALIEMIERLEINSIQVFDLDDIRPDEDFDAMRNWLMAGYGEPLEELEQRTREHEQHQQLFNGIHRFMFEDLVEREPEISRTQARKRSKTLAFEVIRRSNAWSRLVSEIFPHALRLSIHPHPPHSEKIGILLGDADDLWLTPWHGVALLDADRFRLTRRSSAEQQGATLVRRDDRPSHFEIPSRGNDETSLNRRDK